MSLIPELLSIGPFRGLGTLATETSACLRDLQTQFEAALSDDRDVVSERLGKIQTRVLVAREIVNELVRAISGGTWLSVEREDVHSTIENLNRLLRSCGDVASVVSARPISLPDDIRQQLAAYVREALETSIMATDIIAQASVLADVGFGGAEADCIKASLDEAELRATQSNLLRTRLLQTLFSMDANYSPMELGFYSYLTMEMGRIEAFVGQLTRRFGGFTRAAERKQSSGRLVGNRHTQSAAGPLTSVAIKRTTHASRTA